MKASFESGELQSDVAKTKSARTATEIKIKGEVGPRGHDEMCVYLGGLLTTSDQDASQQQALGSCMTVLGSRFIALHAYENSNDPGAYRKLLGQMKQWALQIRKRD